MTYSNGNVVIRKAERQDVMKEWTIYRLDAAAPDSPQPTYVVAIRHEVQLPGRWRI